MAIDEAADKIPTINSTSLGQPTLISLVGAVDLESIDRLDREFAEATWIGTGQVILDMSELRLIDEPAISSVLRGIDTLRAAATALEIRYPSPMALQLFEMCTQLEVLGIEFTPDPPEHLSDRTFTRKAREVFAVQAVFEPSDSPSSPVGEQRRFGDGDARAPQSPRHLKTGNSLSWSHLTERNNTTGVGTGLLIFAVGAVMRFAVPVTAKGVNLHTIGVILIIAGGIAFPVSLAFWKSWGGFGDPGRKRQTTVSGPDGMTTTTSEEHAV